MSDATEQPTSPDGEDSTRPADDWDRLLVELSGLNDSSFDWLVTKIPKANWASSRQQPVPQRAALLVSWARGPTGPGFRVVDDALADLRGIAVGQPPWIEVPLIIKRLIGWLRQVVQKHPHLVVSLTAVPIVVWAIVILIHMQMGVDIDNFVGQVEEAAMRNKSGGDLTPFAQFNGDLVYGTCVITEVSPLSDGTGSYLFARSSRDGNHDGSVLLEVKFGRNIDLTPMGLDQNLWIRGQVVAIKDGKFKPNSKQDIIVQIEVESYRKVKYR